MADGEGVNVELDGPVAVLTIDRPSARNAISRTTMVELDAALDKVGGSGAHVLVVTGAGDRVFVSGGDLKELAAIRTEDEAQDMAMTMRAVLDRVATLPIPVLGAINGDAYGGGGEVTVACDFRVAADDVRVAFNQVALGIMPAWGGIERLTALIGRGRALYLLASGRVLRAEEAGAWGLFEEVVPRADFEDRWQELAHAVARAPRAALVGIKSVQQRSAPAARPELAAEATRTFSATWVAEDHWRMAEELEARRREAKKG